MLKNVSKFLILAAALAGARAASAGNVTYMIHGNSCVSSTPGLIATPTQWGPYNANTASAMNLTCPMPVLNNYYTSVWAEVIGYSRNTADKLFCTIASTDGNGNNLKSQQAQVSYAPGVNTAITSFNSNVATNMWYVTCHIPYSGANGTSYLTGVYVSLSY
jgi:hypothetical protein